MKINDKPINQDAQYNLGVMCYDGRGADQDYAEAVKWFRLAAKQGDAEAQKALESINKNKGIPALAAK